MVFLLTEPILDFKHPFIPPIDLHLHRRHPHPHHLLDSHDSNGSFVIPLIPNLFYDKSRTNLFSQATQRRPSLQRMNHSNNLASKPY